MSEHSIQPWPEFDAAAEAARMDRIRERLVRTGCLPRPGVGRRVSMWTPRFAPQFLAILMRHRVEDQWAIETLPPDYNEGGTRCRVRFRLKTDTRGDKAACVEFEPARGAVVSLDGGSYMFALDRIFEDRCEGRNYSWGRHLAAKEWVTDDDLRLIAVIEDLLDEFYVRAAVEGAAAKKTKFEVTVDREQRVVEALKGCPEGMSTSRLRKIVGGRKADTLKRLRELAARGVLTQSSGRGLAVIWKLNGEAAR
jgi:hypothetical protein